jgi:AcrR family transcriptional regulator
MPAPKMTRDEAIDRLATVFRAHGYDGSSLSIVAEATGLGRASLYHHFPGGKDEMVREVFRRIGARVDAEILSPLAGPGAPEERLARWARGLERFYACGRENCLLGALVLGGGAERFPDELAASFKALIGTLARTLAAAGLSKGAARRRAEDAISRVQGSLVVARGLGDPGVFQRTVRALPRQLLAPEG